MKVTLVILNRFLIATHHLFWQATVKKVTGELQVELSFIPNGRDLCEAAGRADQKEVEQMIALRQQYAAQISSPLSAFVRCDLSKKRWVRGAG